MSQLKSQYEEVRVPFAKMTFSPDVPSTALGPNEYNGGQNVETDVRGIRSVAGDEAILDTVPGTPTFVTGGFRRNGEFWFIVATTEGKWWASNGVTTWYDITPSGGTFAGYTQATNITEAWNGTVPFFNDSLNPPMFLPDTAGAVLVPYSLQTPIDITNIQADGTYPLTRRVVTLKHNFDSTGSDISGTTLTIGTLTTGAIVVGQYVYGTGVAAGTKIVANLSGTGSGSTWTVNNSQTVASTAIYGTTWSGAPFTAGSSIILAGVNPPQFNGTWTVTSCTTDTVTIECGVIGVYVDEGTIGPKYTWNYDPNWTGLFANFMRLYSTPNVGSILVAGNLTATDLVSVQTNYPVTVRWSQNFGLNEAPLTWQPTVTNIANELEVPLRGPALDAFPSNGQFFLCSYWDTVVFSPINYSTTNAPILGVRLYNQGRGLLSSNCWANTDKMVYGVDARDIWVFDGNDFTGIGNQRVKNWFYDQLAPEYYDRVFMECNTQKNQVEIYYPDADAVGGVPNKMISYRYDLDCWNAPRDIASATMACESPIWYNDSGWKNHLGSRTIVYARGVANVALLQKDQGTTFVTSNANPNGDIYSSFVRDNIKMLPNYSGHTMIHRILPEAVNLDNKGIEVANSTGNLTVVISGANSVGAPPTTTTPNTITLNTNNPWMQINQNAFRVNSLELTNTSNNSIWICNATTWQYTQVEDDR